MKRVYGNVRTELVLSDKAQKLYNETSPLTTLEYCIDDGGFEYVIDFIIKQNRPILSR